DDVDVDIAGCRLCERAIGHDRPQLLRRPFRRQRTARTMLARQHGADDRDDARDADERHNGEQQELHPCSFDLYFPFSLFPFTFCIFIVSAVDAFANSASPSSAFARSAGESCARTASTRSGSSTDFASRTRTPAAVIRRSTRLPSFASRSRRTYRWSSNRSIAIDIVATVTPMWPAR